MSCNPYRSMMLVRKVQPPRYIYVGGDGRLKLSKQSTINTNPTFLPSNPCSCFRYSATSREFIEYRQSSWDRSNPDQLSQSSLATSDGVPPKVLGRLVRKAPVHCLAYRVLNRSPAGRVAEHLPRHRGYTRTCSCDAFFIATGIFRPIIEMF